MGRRTVPAGVLRDDGRQLHPWYIQQALRLAAQRPGPSRSRGQQRGFAPLLELAQRLRKAVTAWRTRSSL